MYLLEIEQSFLEKKERLALLYVSGKLPPTPALSQHFALSEK